MKNQILFTLGLVTLIAAGCAREKAKGECTGDNATICALRTGTQNIGSQQAFVIELDVPKGSSAVYEIFYCPGGVCEFSRSYAIRCTNLTCNEEEQTSNQPAIVSESSLGKLVRFEHMGFTGSAQYRARVAPNGSFVQGSQLQ